MEAFVKPLLSDTQYSWIVVIISAFCFQACSWFIATFCIPHSLPREKNGKWRWKNILVSLIHSAICTVLTLWSFHDSPKLASDMIDTFTPLSLTLVAMSIGYFLYDSVDMLRYCRERSTYELLLHHFTVITAFSIAITLQRYVGYAVVSLTIEINSVFLHTRQLLLLLHVTKQNLFYRCNSLLNIGTYIVFRIGVLAWMTRWLFLNHARVPLPLYAIASLGLATMTVMNIILFYRLIQSDVIRPARGKRRDVAPAAAAGATTTARGQQVRATGGASTVLDDDCDVDDSSRSVSGAASGLKKE